jgi:triacylglycerol lipase
MPAFDPQATRFSAKNAVLLAQLSNAAYRTRIDAETIVRQQLGFTDSYWIDLTKQFPNVYAIGAGCDEFAVIAFRGSQNAKDWMTNVNAAAARFSWFFEGAPETGGVHTGFAMAVRHSWYKIKNAVNFVSPLPVRPPDSTTLQPTLWLTGHSLGAALAVVCGAVLSMVNPVRLVNGIYTFGQPRIGLYNFCGHYDQLLRLQTFRFVNNEDLVPRVPFRGWDYADLGCMIHFDNKGKPVLQSSQWRNFLSRSIESFKEFFDIATHFGVGVGDHDYRQYENLIATHQSELAALPFG